MRNKLAELAHQQWSGWMSHLFTKSHRHMTGYYVIPRSYVENLQRQMSTPYNYLSEEEKEADRKEGDKFSELTTGEFIKLVNRKKEKIKELEKNDNYKAGVKKALEEVDKLEAEILDVFRVSK